MNNNFSHSIKLLGLAAVLAAVTSTVSAWNPPATPGTVYESVPAIINTLGKTETKVGGITSQDYLLAGTLSVPTPPAFPTPGLGMVLAKTLLASDKGLFTDQILIPGTTGQMKIGTGAGYTLTQPLIDSSAYPRPLTLDLTGAASNKAAELRIDNTLACMDNATILSNTSAQQYWSTVNIAADGSQGDNADLLARQVRLTGGNPQPGKILIATNANGDAVWATPKLNPDGTISFDTTTSPVTSGQSCGVPPAPANDIVLPTQVTVIGSLTATNTITETYQLGLLYSDPTAFVGATINQSSITDSSSLLFQYPSTMIGTSIASITIDNNGLISIKRNVSSNPSHTALTDVINTSFSVYIPNLGKTYTITIKDTNNTGLITNFWGYQNIYSNSSHVIKTNGTTHAVNMPDYAALSITKTP